MVYDMVASLSFGSHDESHVILLGDDKDRMKFYPTYVDWNKRKFAPFHAHSVDLDASRLGDLFRANSTFDGFSPEHTCNYDSECHASSVCRRFKCQNRMMLRLERSAKPMPAVGRGDVSGRAFARVLVSLSLKLVSVATKTRIVCPIAAASVDGVVVVG